MKAPATAVASLATAGQRYKREILAWWRNYPRVERCHLPGVSLFCSELEFKKAHAVWLERIELNLIAMDATGAATPEEALATLKVWKEQAEQAAVLRAEIEALRKKATDADSD